jgi:hypothetical protein
MPEGAHLLRVWEGRDTMIYEEAIPDPPQVQITEQHISKVGIELDWSPQASFQDSDLRYLVQFEDAPGVWRGIAPRDTKRSLFISSEFFKLHNPLHIRLLTSSGIATSSIDEWLTLESDTDQRTPTDQPPIVVSPNGVLEPGKAIGSYLRAVSSGMQLRWYDDAGAELSGSATLNLQGLSDGQHTVRAVAVGGNSMQTSYALLINKDGDLITFLQDLKPKHLSDVHLHPHTTTNNQE